MPQLIGRSGIGDAEFQVGSVDDGMYLGAIGLYNASGTSMTAAALRTALEDAQEVFVALEFVVGNDVYNSGPFPVFPASDDYDSTFVLNDQGTPWEDTTTIQVDTGMDAEGIALLAEFEDLLQAGIVDADFVGRFVDLIETGDYASESGTVYFYIGDKLPNKIVYNGETLIDLTGDTVTAAVLMAGYTAHDASGQIITGTSQGGEVTTYWATSTATDSAVTKAVVCSGYSKKAGNIVAIKFDTANTAATFTLDINNTGGAAVYTGDAVVNGTTNTCKWSPGSTVIVVYDGVYYRIVSIVSGANVRNWLGAGSWYGTCSTAAATRAKVTTIANFRLCVGAIVTVNFSTANTYVSNSVTLNVNSTGAKSIYANGAITGTTNKLLWSANTVMTFIYDGTYYRLVKRTGPTDDYIVESGTANGWNYEKYSSGRIAAWGEFSISIASGNGWRATISTPVTMADAAYIAIAQVPNWRVDYAYAGNRTTTNFQIGVTASGSDTVTAFCELRGTYA